NFLGIDFVSVGRNRRVLEPSLGWAPVQRHLPALEPFNPRAGARALVFAAAPAGFPQTRADAAADAGTFLARSRPVSEFVKLHRLSPYTFTTRTKCLTLAIIPRVCGVSGNSTMRPIRLRPSPISVSRWLWWRRMGLPICWILMTLSLLLMSASRRALFSRRPAHPRRGRAAALAASTL